MTGIANGEIAGLVEPDRVHRRVYTDPDLFELEMARIFDRLWIFVGHESQLPNPGDYLRSRMGTRQILVTRDENGAIHVLNNRCTHRGMKVCVHERGNGRRLVCPYHGWAFHIDGRLAGVPHRSGYDKSRDLKDPMFNLVAAPRVASYRGFVFASMAEDGPDLVDYLGDIADALDNIADRAPDGAVEIAGGVIRQEYRGNWKMHMENACDLVHPGFVHDSAVDSARDFDRDAIPVGQAEQALQMFGANGISLKQWDELGVYGFENGHCYMDGFYRGGLIDPQFADPVFDAYRELLVARHGAERVKEIFARDTFNNLIYPNMSINTRFQQMRVIHPVAVDRTHIYSYSLRLKGAPEEMFRMSLRFVSTANSPSSPISSDDLMVFEQVQAALGEGGPDWLDFSRRFGEDREFGTAGRHDIGTSELPMRTLLAAWRRYMTGAPEA